MLEDLRFRDATVDDLTIIVAIYNSTLSSRKAAADIDPITVESVMIWFRAHGPRTRPIWVVETAQRHVIAWLSFSDFYGRPAYRATAELSIYIDEPWRAQGLGKRLLARALEYAPSLGVDTVLGFVFAHNAPSLKLFHGFGFSDWGRLPRVARFGNVECDLVILGHRVTT